MSPQIGRLCVEPVCFPLYLILFILVLAYASVNFALPMQKKENKLFNRINQAHLSDKIIKFRVKCMTSVFFGRLVRRIECQSSRFAFRSEGRGVEVAPGPD